MNEMGLPDNRDGFKKVGFFDSRCGLMESTPGDTRE
jgi:hypothetical protein